MCLNVALKNNPLLILKLEFDNGFVLFQLDHLTVLAQCKQKQAHTLWMQREYCCSYWKQVKMRKAKHKNPVNWPFANLLFSEIISSVEGKNSLTINFRGENILSSAHNFIPCGRYKRTRLMYVVSENNNTFFA